MRLTARGLLLLAGLTACGGDNGGTPPPNDDDETGVIAFWTKSAASIPITVRLNGVERTIPIAMATAPSCSASNQAALFEVPLGAQVSFTASSAATSDTWDDEFTVTEECLPWELLATPPPPPTTSLIHLWTRNAALVPITLSGNGQAWGAIVNAFTFTPQLCTDGSGNIVRQVTPGANYRITGTGSGGVAWDFTVTAPPAGQCLLQELTGPPSPQNGQVVFWSANDIGGPITVRVNGVVIGTTANYSVNNTPPPCGQAGFVTYTGPAGPVPYSAVNQVGGTWTGNATIVANACSTFRLNAGDSDGRPGVTTLTIWTSRTGGGPINVGVQGASVGQLTSFYTGIPACGAPGTITKTLEAGTIVRITGTQPGTGTTWDGLTSRMPAGCYPYELR